MVHSENAKCFARLFSQSQSTTEEECGIGGRRFLSWKAQLEGRFKGWSTLKCAWHKVEKGRKPQHYALQSSPLPRSDKMCKARSGKKKKKKVLILLGKARQQQFKMCQRILAGMKEKKRKRSFNKHVIKELKLAFQNKVFLVYIFF